MKPGAADPHWVEVDGFVAAYEAARQDDREANVADFLPAPDHPLYREALRELVRVDLECGWDLGQPRPLEEYLRLFPELIEDRDGLREIAFEEYRLRQQAGVSPSPAEYQKRLGIDTQDWPGPSPSPQPLSLRGERGWGEGAEAGLTKAALAYQEWRQRPAADEGLDDCWEPFPGRVEYAQLFRELHDRDPQAADRLAQALVAMPEVGSEFLGFHLRTELGRGTFGRVFLAWQGELGNRPVALKIATNIDGETRTLVQLQHPNIIPVHSIHQVGPLQAICMPYFGGTTLAHVLKELRGQECLPASGKSLVHLLNEQRTKVPLEVSGLRPPEPQETVPGAVLEMLTRMTYVQAVLWIAARLADGLAHAHDRGILHRDLKPANVLLTDEGQPMLLDFNLAADVKLRASASAAFLGGTLYYSAPEFLESLKGATRPVEQRSDLYALGVILYELLTGRPPFPFRHGPLRQVLSQMAADRRGSTPEVRRWNRAVSPAVEAIVRHCLEPNPDRRYQTAGELREDLRCHLDDLPLRHASEPSRAEGARKWMRRHPRLTSSACAGALAVLLLVVLGAVLFSRGQHLNRLQAQEARQHLGTNLKAVHFLLSRPDAEQRQREEGLTLCRETLEPYQVLEADAWQEGPLVRALPPEDRLRLREGVGELLLLWARAVSWEAGAAGDPSHREERAGFALELNSRAAACYAPDEAPRALWAQRAHLHRLGGQEDEARRLQEKAEQMPLTTPRERYLLVLHQLDQGQMPEALAYLRDASRQEPDNFSIWLVLGNCYAALGQRDEAISCYDLAISLWPGSSWAHFNRGLLLFEHGAFDRAGEDFDRVIRLRPDLREAYFNRALANFRLGRLAEANTDLDHLLEQWEKPPTRAFFARARVRAKRGDTEGARRDQDEGLRREPTDENDCIARGVARFSGDPKGALTEFERALVFNPLSRRAMQNQASVLAEKLDRTAEAVQVLDRLLALYPDSVIARAGRGVLRARLGRRDAAHQDAQDSLARDRQPATLYQVAGIYALTSRQEPDDRREAIQLLAAALQKEYGFDLLEEDRDLDPLRNDPEFQRLLKTARPSAAPGDRRGTTQR